MLPADQAAAIEAHYGVSEAGNFEGRNILHVVQDLDQTWPRRGSWSRG